MSLIEGEWGCLCRISNDLIKWLQLPDITREDIDISENIKGRFTGDPAYEYRFGKWFELYLSLANWVEYQNVPPGRLI